ncbi:MAG: 2OG-Fe(II) oxygenase, partial [Pseudolabrys sp.]
MAPTAPGGIKKKKNGTDMTVPEFAMPPDAVPGIAQVIVNAWNGDASLSNILDRTNPGPQGVATATAVAQATAAINAAAPGYNLNRCVIITENEHDRGYTMETVQAAKSRVAKYDWAKVLEELSSQGCAVIERLLSPDECRQVATLYPQEEHFRSHVHMARHGFGKGEYRYFKYPLPLLLSSLRTTLYPHLAVIANDWNARMNIDRRYPAQHADFLK